MLKSRPVPFEPYEPRLPESPGESVRAEELLPTAELRQRLAARERSVGDRLAALRSEVTTLDDLTLGGRPALDHVRAHPLAAFGLALAAGAVVGVAAGWLGRLSHAAEDEQETVMRLLTDSVVDEAARRVALGDRPDRALERVLRKRAPVVNYTPPSPPERGAVRQSLDLAVKSAVGFGVKAALDTLSKQLTGKPEIIAAVADSGGPEAGS